MSKGQGELGIVLLWKDQWTMSLSFGMSRIPAIADDFLRILKVLVEPFIPLLFPQILFCK
jgi:hypothetical protein